MMSITLVLPGETTPLVDPEDIYQKLKDRIDLFVDGGACGYDPTSIVDLTGPSPEVLRVGKGDVSGMV